MTINPADFSPGKLVDLGDGRYKLTYTAFPDFEGVFQPRGLQGSGHTWYGMVMHLMEENAPEALDSIEFVPETDLFCAVSDDLEALKAVGRMLTKLEDRAIVADILKHIDLTEYD